MSLTKSDKVRKKVNDMFSDYVSDVFNDFVSDVFSDFVNDMWNSYWDYNFFSDLPTTFHQSMIHIFCNRKPA